MTKSQWKALFDFCRENCITKGELLNELKENGTVSHNAELEELSDYTSDKSYIAMRIFLEENV